MYLKFFDFCLGTFHKTPTWKIYRHMFTKNSGPLSPRLNSMSDEKIFIACKLELRNEEWRKGHIPGTFLPLQNLIYPY